jgi:hypothetical protein
MELRSFLYMLLVLIYINSCSYMKTETGQTEWLDQPICSPPCWATITPGKTSLEDALSILENIPEITITFKSQGGIDWQFREARNGAGSLSIENGIVSFIRVGTSLNKSPNMEKIVASYSHPNYVKPYDCRDGMCSTLLVYPDLGMFLSVYVQDIGITNTPQIEILPTTIVENAYFIQPGMENFQKTSFGGNDLLMDWHGYGVYP